MEANILIVEEIFRYLNFIARIIGVVGAIHELPLHKIIVNGF